MKVPHKYKNAIRSKQQIKDALITIIIEADDLSKITITDIVKKAHVNRGTFYSHYNNLEDIFIELKNDFINKLVNILNKYQDIGFTNNTLSFFESIGSFIEDNLAHYKAAFKSKYAHSLLNAIKEVIMSIILKDEKLMTLFNDFNHFYTFVDFCTSGLIGLYYDWLNDKLPFSIDELAHIANEIATKKIATLLG